MESGGRGDVLPFYLSAQHKTGIMVLSTVVLTSFMGLDSFDKTRFRFIAGHHNCCGKKDSGGGRGDVFPFHLIAQHKTGIMVLSTVVPTSFVGVDSFVKTRFKFFA